VEEVELTDLDSGRIRTVACDTVVFTADWIPDHELAVTANLELDPLTRGPAVDAALRTSAPGVFAAGNLLHGAEQADVAALGGRHVAAAVARYLDDGNWPSQRVPIVCEPPLGWIAPNAISGTDAPPRDRFALRARELVSVRGVSGRTRARSPSGRAAGGRSPRVELTQAGRTLWSGRVGRLTPGRSARLPYDWARDVDLSGEQVVCALHRPG
jgi:hypothetical protein